MFSAFELRSKIDEFLMALAINRVDRFYPTALSKFLGITPGEAFNHLLERTGNDDQLSLVWEVRCPDCYRTIDILPNQITDDYDCYCGEEFESDEDNLYPVFKINDNYKEHIKSELQKKNQNTSPESPKRTFSPADLKGQPSNLRKLLAGTALTTEAAEALVSSGITTLNFFMGDGFVGENHKIESSFNGSQLNGNTAIQSKNTSQVQQGTKIEYSAPLKELEGLISQLSEELDREQAETNAEMLTTALENEDKPKIEKYIRFLAGALGVVTPLVTIAQLAGIPLPNFPTK